MKISPKLQQEFSEWRQTFAVLSERRPVLGRRLMRAYVLWAAKTEGTFVEFLRELDPSIPADRAGYRRHKTYLAAEYLRRLSHPGG